MADLIERQAAIDAISCDITVTGRQNAELVAATIGTFAERIKALPSAQPEQHWIPCSERLPEEGEKVLCCFRNGDNYKIIVSKRTDYNYWSSVGRTGDTIAWMPLPEPWRGEEHERSQRN